MAIRENRTTMRQQINALLPTLELLDVFWVDSSCPDCRDDAEYFFVIDKQFYKVNDQGYVDGGYVCCGCGWSNAGGIHESELPENYNATYH